MPRWVKRPEGSNRGNFGPDDQRVRLTLLTPQCVREAAPEVREGLSFCLGPAAGFSWWLMMEGKIVESGFASDMFSHPGLAKMQEFLAGVLPHSNVVPP